MLLEKWTAEPFRSIDCPNNRCRTWDNAGGKVPQVVINPGAYHNNIIIIIIIILYYYYYASDTRVDVVNVQLT